ncbi:MAG: DUF4197 domain-containing protein [Bacteroidales bacterium]|jgi:hypothetical protein|nr:DUF4197 domain-containing protein [Bacteroidales bacterium]
MKKIITLIFIAVFTFSCDVLNNIAKAPTSTIQQLSQTDIANGLKSALNVGTGNSVNLVSALNGYYGNSLIKIPFPKEAQAVKDMCDKVPALKTQMTQFEEKLNRAAEDAAKGAKDVFISAITQMTISDAISILKGQDNAATEFLKKTTYNTLYQKFLPIVKQSTEKVMLAKYWTPIADKYNSTAALVTGKKVTVDLNDYVTNKALDGLFIMLAKEEEKIRVNPTARVNDILKRVFGSSYNPHNSKNK